VRRLGLVELQRPSDRTEHLVGDAAEVAALQPGVVVDAHAGDHRHLFAPQAGHPPMAAVGEEIRLLGGDLRPARAEEIADLRSMVHFSTVRRGSPRWEDLPVHGCTGTPPLAASVVAWKHAVTPIA
jgi:hypothetical protein